MRLDKDQRGFVLSGLALLLILPAMLLSASCLTIIKMGGETVSLQTVAGKVYNTGLSVENTIKWMWLESGVPVDNDTLLRLQAEWENATGLVVGISNVEENYAKVRVIIQDSLGSARFEDVLELMEFLKLSTRFQDFETGNGTPGDYFYDVWYSNPSFETSTVHWGTRSVKMVASAGGIGGNGGTIGINVASPSGYLDLSGASTFSVWVYDTQGNNTIQLRFKDADGDGGSGADGNYLWSTVQPQQNQWTEITWDLSDYPSVPNLDWDRIAAVEFYEWWDGTYYFDDLTFS